MNFVLDACICLDALLLTNACFSVLAYSAAARIRVVGFSEFDFFVNSTELVIHKLAHDQVRPQWTVLKFTGEADL